MGEPSNPSDAYDSDGDEAPRTPRRSRHSLRLPTELNRMDAPDDPPPLPAASGTLSMDGSSTVTVTPGERASFPQEVEVHFDATRTVSLPPPFARTPPPDGPTNSMLVVRRRVRMIGQEDGGSSSPPPPGPIDPVLPPSLPPSSRLPERAVHEVPSEPSSARPTPALHPPSPAPVALDGADDPERMTLPMPEPTPKRPSHAPPSVEDAIPKRPSTPPARRPSNPPSRMPTTQPSGPASSGADVASEGVAAQPALPSSPPPLPRPAALPSDDTVLEIERISTPPDDEAVDVSMEEAAPAAVPTQPTTEPPPPEPTGSPSPPAATAAATPDELTEISTEAHEFLDPDAIEHVDTPPRGTSLPPPPPKDIPRSPGKTSMPPAAPSKVTGHATIPDARPKRRRMWWEEIFNEDYFRTMAPYTPEQVRAEVDWIEQALGVEAGASILDVACGAGRQAVEFARRRYDVMGVDLSVAMLTRAAELAQEHKVHVALTQCDMAAMEFDGRYDAAYCVGSSFGFFDDARNAEVARRIHRALKPHGTFLLAVLNRDHTIQRQPAMAWFEGDGCVCMEESSFNFITSRLNVKRTMIFDDGRQREFEYSMRLYSLHELGQVLHDAGFRILEVSGAPRTPGAFFGPSSRELIILAQKRGQEVVDLHGEAGDSSRPA